MSLATTPAIPPPSPGGDDEPAAINGALFFRMIAAGLFTGRRVYLWNGRLLERMAKTVSHATTAVRVQQTLAAVLPAAYLLWPENPIQVGDQDAPLPDNVVVRGPLERFDDEGRHPRPDDVALVVEIAVSSLPKDLGERAAKYAAALIPHYWVFDVAAGRVVVHEFPERRDGVGAYLRVRPLDVGDVVGLVLDGQEAAQIPVASFFTPRKEQP